MIINFSNIGSGSGGGGSYTLPVATENSLGGVKVGSGLTITDAGVLSADEATVIDLSALSAMTSADRVALWDEVYEKAAADKSVFMKGAVLGEAGRTAILPMVSFRPETAVATHEGGNLYFAAKGDTDNIYFHVNFGSDGTILPVEGLTKTSISKVAGSDTLGMVKVGSGLTIDVNGVLSATGGGGDSNYVIVDALSAITAPTEGLMAWVKKSSSVTETVKVYISDPQSWEGWDGDRPEGGLASIKESEESGDALQIYLSTENFYWDYDNDGLWHSREWNGYTITYRTHNIDGTGGSWIEFEPLPEGLNFYFATGAGSATTESVFYSGGEKYIFKDEEWCKLLNSNYLFVEDHDNPNTGDVISFREMVLSNPQENYYIETNHEGSYFRMYYAEVLDGNPVFNYDLGGGHRVGYALTDDGGVGFVHNDSVSVPGQHNISINASGEVQDNGTLSVFMSEEMYRACLRYDYTNALSPDGGNWSMAPIKYVYRQFEEVNGETKLVYYFGGDIMIGSTLYRGTWHFVEWEWGDTPLAPDTWAAV